MSNQSDTKRRLVASFMKFLSEEMKGDELSSEAKDSIEGLIECYRIGSNNIEQLFQN